VVGIVSHVPELKDRISERITVVPGRDGTSRVVVSA
jgi:DNA repair exonuclease SbcCD ATPase subunit